MHVFGIHIPCLLLVMKPIGIIDGLGGHRDSVASAFNDQNVCEPPVFDKDTANFLESRCECLGIKSDVIVISTFPS